MTVTQIVNGVVVGIHLDDPFPVPGRRVAVDRDTILHPSSLSLLSFLSLCLLECRCDERLETKAEGSIRLGYTGLLGGLEHVKIETRLIDEMFASVMGECVIVKL